MADSPCHNHHNGGNSNMRTRKSRSGTLSYLLGGLNQIIEKTVFVARTGKQKSMMVEIITDRGKNPGAYIIHSDDREIELRTGYRHKYIKQIINKKETTSTKQIFSNHLNRNTKYHTVTISIMG